MQRWLPLGVLLTAFVIGVPLRMLRQHKHTGHWGLAIPRGHSIRDVIPSLVLLVCVAAAFLQAITVALRGQPANLLFSFPPAAALAIAAAGTAMMVAAQANLGSSWRIGVDWDARAGLVNSGIYRWSRNPIFVSVFVVGVGYCLLLPALSSFATLAVMAVAIHAQVQTEEDYLSKTYGSDFDEYRARVNRYLPGLR